MIDFKKLQFLSSLQEIIKNNPEYAGDAFHAINKGVKEAVDEARNDNYNMAAMLMLSYLANKYDKKISGKSKLRIIEMLKHNFQLEVFDRLEAVEMMENWRDSEVRKDFIY